MIAMGWLGIVGLIVLSAAGGAAVLYAVFCIWLFDNWPRQ